MTETEWKREWTNNLMHFFNGSFCRRRREPRIVLISVAVMSFFVDDDDWREVDGELVKGWWWIVYKAVLSSHLLPSQVLTVLAQWLAQPLAQWLAQPLAQWLAQQLASWLANKIKGQGSNLIFCSKQLYWSEENDMTLSLLLYVYCTIRSIYKELTGMSTKHVTQAPFHITNNGDASFVASRGM